MKKNRNIIRQMKLGLKNQLANINQKTIIVSEQEIQEFYYISDIHIDNQFNENISFNEKLSIAENIAKKIVKEYKNKNAYLLIAGDLVRNIYIAKHFYEILTQEINPSKIVVVLGNHELVDENFINNNLKEIIKKYKEMFLSLGINFLNDDLMIVYKEKINIINKNEILDIEDYKIKEICANNLFMIFGSLEIGYREEYGDYGLDLIEESRDDIFCNSKLMYDKIARVFKNDKVICLTHFPKSIDEINDLEKYERNWIYVHGHTHKDFYINNDQKSIYADNQIVNPKYIKLKKFSFQKNKFKNIFAEFEDGIHNISYREYLNLYSNCGFPIEFNNRSDEIYLVKKDMFAIFFLKSKKFNKYYLLEGGSIRNINNQDLKYYHENLQFYAESILDIISPYEEEIKRLSIEVKRFGGEGNIHGCIVNIDFYNHIYLNPVDSKITAYFAKDVTERIVFKNVPSLLKYNCKELYQKYEREVLIKFENVNSIVLRKNQEIEKETINDNSPIYKISNIIRNMQYVFDCGIVRSWNEKLLYINKENFSLNKKDLFLNIDEK